MADVLVTENQENAISQKPEHIAETSEMTKSEPSVVFPCDNLVVNPDDLLPPVVKLEKYATSDIVFNRQVVARNLLETLRVVVNDEDDVSRVIAILCTLADDYEPSVRAEVIQQLPYIGVFCNKNGCYLSNLVEQCFVPLIIKYLTDMNNQVRKASQATLLLTVEHSLIDEATLEDKVCSLILQLTESHHMEDQRAEAVNLMCKLAPLVGQELTERLFLPCFVELCSDSSFQVRKVCAENFGDFCALVEQERTEQLLLPKFYSLCKDSICGIRKVCAEVFLHVSRVCAMETRHNDLAPAYINLLLDTSRWVRNSAFQGLGPFISTFAEPTKSGLYYDSFGILIVTDPPPYHMPNAPVASLQVDEQTEPDSNSHSCLSESSCDNIVPSCHANNNCDSQCVQSTTCHTTGSYSTVIELDSKECDSEEIQSKSNSLHYNDCDHKDVSENCVSLSCNGVSEQYHECEESEAMDDSLYVHTDRISPSSDFKISEIDVTTESLCNGDLIEYDASEESCEQYIVEEVCSNVTVRAENNCLPLSSCTDTIVNGLEDASDIEFGDNACLEFDMNSLDSCSRDSMSTMCNGTTEDVFSNADHDEVSGLHCSELDCESAYNHFQFWRNPIPDLELNFSLEEICDKKHELVMRNVRNGFRYESDPNVLRSQFSRPTIISFSSENSPIRRTSSDLSSRTEGSNEVSESEFHSDGEPSPQLKDLAFVNEQDIVPPELLFRFLSMTCNTMHEPSSCDLVHHCAYSLPAVALTLGRSFWPCLRETYNTLASDMQGFVMQWKIRRTLASSMHQLAVILGPDITAQDLLPVFSGLIQDIDEVRIGVLRHLSEFLCVLRVKERKEYLPRFSEFLNTENERNWRFRLTLAEQLIKVSTLYDPCDVREYLVPLSFALVRDKVSEVRLVAARVMAVMMRHMSSNSPTPTLTKEVLTELADQFIYARKWLHRQIYVFLCQEFIKENSLPPDQFAEDAMPHLLYLCWDRVANVRLAIARCLAVVIWPMATFSDPNSPHQELILQAIHTLQSDVDADVRYFANMVATHGCTCLHHSLTNDMEDLHV